MKFYQQTAMHTEETKGDCWRACVATILQLPMDEVPHFLNEGEWPWNFLEWLDNRKLVWIEFAYPDGLDAYSELWGLHTIVGPSPRGGCDHAVIGKNGEMIFDPHPSGDGLGGSEKEWKHGFIFPKREELDQRKDGE